MWVLELMIPAILHFLWLHTYLMDVLDGKQLTVLLGSWRLLFLLVYYRVFDKLGGILKLAPKLSCSMHYFASLKERRSDQYWRSKVVQEIYL